MFKAHQSLAGVKIMGLLQGDRCIFIIESNTIGLEKEHQHPDLAPGHAKLGMDLACRLCSLLHD